ncbi:hypothetical protein [Brucella oryzae]|uniref:hypothetical protein n=1 Tax=Brucella oryzae TaxID=335286 RepID=UPI0011AFE479|nr:hypothetical protein [Brucella oryzae]
MDWSNDSCPVCRQDAREALPRMGDFAEIICDDCGRYRISGSSLEVMRHEDDADIRKSALQHAITDAGGNMPFIKGFGG